ncbi:ribonucleoside diphosreductase [Escherichia coli]|nr:ribonucleoside diphosreductase [Escherichia coli]
MLTPERSFPPPPPPPPKGRGGKKCRMRFAYPAYKIAACRPDKTRQRRIRRYIPDVAT